MLSSPRGEPAMISLAFFTDAGEIGGGHILLEYGGG